MVAPASRSSPSAPLPYVALPISQDDITYAHGPDSIRRAGVPEGALEELVIEDCVAYPGTRRRVWIHTPAGLTPDEEASVMFFTDGWWNLDPESEVRGAVVLDNLAAAGDIPPLIGVFVDPGVFDDESGPRKNRNAEYDAFDSRHADFLVDEILPLVEARQRVSRAASSRGICGGSSGGDAAFTAAWTRPDAIGRVLAFNASFAQMPGGNPYPELLARADPRPIRVLLHAAHRDVGWNQREGNWFAENLRTAAALAEAGYDMRLVLGDGGHGPNHAGVLLPDALRWLWRPMAEPLPARRP